MNKTDLISINYKTWDRVIFGDQTLLIHPNCSIENFQAGQEIVLQGTTPLFGSKKEITDVKIIDVSVRPFSHIAELEDEDILMTGNSCREELYKELEETFGPHNIFGDTPVRFLYFTPPIDAELLHNIRCRLCNGLERIVEDKDIIDQIEISYDYKPSPSLDIYFDRPLKLGDFSQVSRWFSQIAPRVEACSDKYGDCFAMPYYPYEIKTRLDLLAELQRRRHAPPGLAL